MKPPGIALPLAAAFCLLAAVLAIVGWQGISHLRQLNAQMQNTIHGRWKEELLAHEAFSLSSQNSRITLLIFLGQDREKTGQLLVQRAANTQRITVLVDLIKPGLETEKEKQIFAVVEAARKPYLEGYQRALSLLLTEHKDEDARKMMANFVQPGLVAYHEAWAAFDRYEVDEIDQVLQQSKLDFVVGQRHLWATLALSGFVTVVIAVFTITRVDREIAVRHRAEQGLQQAHGLLEARVIERTAELANTNQALQTENAERKRAELELGSKTAFLEAQIHSSIDGILVVDQGRKVSLLNQRFVDLFKMPQHLAGAGDVENRLRWITDQVKIPEVFYEKVLYLYAHPSATSHDEIELKDGTILDRHTFPAIGKEGSYYGRIWTYHDITDQRLAENLVRQSEGRYRSLFDNARDAIFTIAVDGTFTSLNPAVEAMAGIARADWIGKPFAPMVHPDDLPLAAKMFNRILQGEHAAVHELRGHPSLPRPALMEMTLTAQKEESGKIIGVLGIGRDITERKQSDGARDRLAAILESTTDLVSIADPAGRLIYLNRAGRTLLGVGLDEDVTKAAIRDFLPNPDSHPVFTTGLPAAIRQGSWGGEVVILSRGGKEIPVSQVILTHNNHDGKIEFTSTIMRDMTERRTAEVELENIHKQLVESSRLAGMAEIATSVLHNVGNVLNSVNISTGLIDESVKNSKASSLARVVELLQKHAEDLGAFLTHDPRGQHVPAILARLSEHLMAEEGKITGELVSLRRNVEHIKEIVAMQQNYAMVGGLKEVIDLISLVEDSLRLNEDAFRRHGVEVVRELAKVPPMNIEKHKVLQILVNLVRNAKYACDDSGRTDRRVTMRVANGDGSVKISVLDNGVGIPPENLARIFNYGFTTRKGGHGFGLHSSALAAREMGGSLTVLSGGLGQGAKFTLELPCPIKENAHE
jgi:PAS domain S-box-containing protein